MGPERHIRAVAAVMVGLIITAAIGLFTFISALPFRIICDWIFLGHLSNPLEKMPKYWSAFIHHVCVRWILRVRVRVEGSDKPAQPNELILCIANHPSTLAVASVIWYITHHFAAHVLAVAKRGHLTNPFLAPFIGLPLWAIRAGIFINRDDTDAAFASIRRAVSGIARSRPLVLVIFPDQHRPTRQRIARDRAYFSPSISDLQEWLHATLVPRSGGTLELMRGLYHTGRPIRIVTITNAFDVENNGIHDIGNLFDATLRVAVEWVTSLPQGESALRAWLIKEWRHKNMRILDWRNSRPN